MAHSGTICQWQVHQSAHTICHAPRQVGAHAQCRHARTRRDSTCQTEHDCKGACNDACKDSTFQLRTCAPPAGTRLWMSSMNSTTRPRMFDSSASTCVCACACARGSHACACARGSHVPGPPRNQPALLQRPCLLFPRASPHATCAHTPQAATPRALPSAPLLAPPRTQPRA